MMIRKIDMKNAKALFLNYFDEILLRKSLRYSQGKATASFLRKTKDKIEVLKGIFLKRQLFSFGNHKLFNNIATFSLTSVLSCLNCKDCKKSCYARKSERQYINTWNKRLILTYLAVNDLERLEELIEWAIAHFPKKGKNKIDFVRIHESGDFVSQAYIDMWARIARRHPEYNFYFYTKVDKLFDFSDFESLENVKNNKSLIEIDGKFYPNFGKKDYLEKLKKLMDEKDVKYIHCGYGTENEKICGLECVACMKCKKLVTIFNKH